MRHWKPIPPRLVMLGIVLLFLGVDARICIAVLGVQPPGVDWAPLWAAARMPPAQAGGLYDFARITRAQARLIGIVSGVRPFIYPPSALPLFAPFALLPVLASYAAWTGATAAFYLAASARLGARWWLLLLTPPVVLAALAGQTGLLLGGMIAAALTLLEKRPGSAGIIFGIATAIKPQLLILVPVALVVARNGRALLGWGGAGAAMLLLSAVLFGPGAWLDWLAALPRFQALLQDSPTLLDDAIAPYALAQRMGFAGGWVIAVAAVPALAAVWASFRRPASPSERLIALVGGALLISPYAMNYELTLLAPALVAGARHGPARAVLLLAIGLSVPFGLGFWGLAAAMLALAASLSRAVPPGDPAPGAA